VESVVGVHGQQSERQACTHQPEGRLGRAALSLCDFSGRQRTRGQVIRDRQLGVGPKRLADPIAHQHVRHLLTDVVALR